MNSLIPLIFIAILSFSNLAYSKKIPCLVYNKFPTLIEGCEGELCGLLAYNKTIKQSAVFAHPNDRKQLDILRVCEPIKNFSPHIWVIAPGSIRIEQLTSELKKRGLRKGDTLTLINYVGEGVYAACAGSEIFDLLPESHDGKSLTKKITAPRTEAWVKITSPRMKTGYIQGHDFYMGHGDLDLAKLCGNDHPFGEHHQLVQSRFLVKLAEEIKAQCFSNEDLAEGQPKCKRNSSIWDELKKSSSHFSACSNFELSKVLSAQAWIGSFNCPKSPNSSDQWHFNLSCELKESRSQKTQKADVICFLGT